MTAICLANEVRAQFYDSADDIYFYVNEYEKEWYQESSTFVPGPGGGYFRAGKWRQKTPKEFDIKDGDSWVQVWNFDGKKAAMLWAGKVKEVKDKLKNNPSFFEELVETEEYDIHYSSSTYEYTIYKYTYRSSNRSADHFYKFSKDRNICVAQKPPFANVDDGEHYNIYRYKRVDKSFFKVGRSRTPNNTMYE